MNSKWQQIWNQREVGSQQHFSLNQLIQLDGFDGGAGRVEEADWLVHCQRVLDCLDIRDGESIYEVGCGSGAFLLGLARQRKLAAIGGLDFSQPLIDVASKVFTAGDFQCGEAQQLSGEKDYDYVISHGVFHYFSESYAENVLTAMLRKARKAICVLDVPDLALKEQAEAIRREHLTEAEYNKKYQGLLHTYYSKSWFREFGLRHQLEAQILDGMMPNYAQRPYRFGCVIRAAHEGPLA